MKKEYVDMIKEDLNKYDMDRESLLTQCIREKLERTLKNYNEDITKSSDFLLTRESSRVMKAITKAQKNADKEMLENTIDDKDQLGDDYE